MRKRQKGPEKSLYFNCRGKKTNLGSSPFSMQGQCPNEKLPALPHPKDAGKSPLLVEGSLEDESDVALLPSQLLGTEGAGGVEGMCAVRQRDLTPEGRRLIRTNVATGVKGVSGRSGVYVKPRLAAQPQRHVRPFGSAHGTLPLPALPALPLLAVVAPVVVAVHVAALEVDPGLLLVRRVLATHGGEGQRVEAHGTLRAGCVDLLPQRLQVFEGGSARQAFGSAPEQGRAAKVDERAVDQLLTLSLHLEHREVAEMSCFGQQSYKNTKYSRCYYNQGRSQNIHKIMKKSSK